MNARTLLFAIMYFTFLSNLFAGESASVDLSTPERAVQSLEAAWRANDIEKAVRCKDFRGEAEQILRDKPAAVRTEDIIAQTGAHQFLPRHGGSVAPFATRAGSCATAGDIRCEVVPMTARPRPNQAMQLTASKSDVYAVSVCHPRFPLRRDRIGLAAADLVSR